MIVYVLDSSAMVAYLRSEQGADLVREALADLTNRCFAHAINLCEVYYGGYRERGEAAAQEMLQDLYTAGVRLRDDFDSSFWQDAGRLKADHRRVSLADCCCVALARRVDGELLTSDHHAFDRIAPLNLCRLRFIR